MRNYQKLFFDGFLLTKRKAVMSNSISYSKLVKKGYKCQNLKINCKSEKLLLITIVNNLSFQFLVNKLCKKIALCSKIHCVKSVQILSFFWSVFSSIRTEYGEILRISPYLVGMRENKDQKKLRIWTRLTQWFMY